jgi:hypothetical protein
LSQSIVVPGFTFRTIEATVLNRLSFGQTDLVSGPAFIVAAPAIDFYHQDLTRKMEF